MHYSSLIEQNDASLGITLGRNSLLMGPKEDRRADDGRWPAQQKCGWQPCISRTGRSGPTVRRTPCMRLHRFDYLLCRFAGRVWARCIRCVRWRLARTCAPPWLVAGAGRSGRRAFRRTHHAGAERYWRRSATCLQVFRLGLPGLCRRARGDRWGWVKQHTIRVGPQFARLSGRITAGTLAPTI